MSCKCHKTNFKDETLRVLTNYDLKQSDVIWVGGNDFTIPVSEFWSLAESLDYDSGFGEQIIAKDLTIVCNGGFLTRGSYDGIEWWKFHSLPFRPAETQSITSLSVPFGTEGGKTLKEINFPVNDTEQEPASEHASVPEG